MNNDNARSLLANPLPILMIVLLAAGVLIKQEPLQSARPNDPERVKFVPAGQQDVEARLWQDPFAAVEKHEGRSQTTNRTFPTTHTSKELRTLIENKSKPDSKVKIIGVSVFGGSYSEAAESRRRTRFAVLSALGFHGYSPANPDAIGYFRIKLLGASRNVTWPDPKNVGLDFTLIGPAGSTMLLDLIRKRSDPALVDLTVPYEWFERQESPSHVLMLWVNENKLTGGALAKLENLIRELTPEQGTSPSTTGNGSMQDFSLPANGPMLKIFVPTATIPGCDLAASMPVTGRSSTENMVKPTWNCFMGEPPPLNELTNLPIVRTIGTDDVLAAALLWELWQRGVNRGLGNNGKRLTPTAVSLFPAQNSATSTRKCADGLVLISEWDSDYARALSVI